MNKAVAIGLVTAAGAGVAALIYKGSRDASRHLGGTTRGVKGSPFAVDCTFDKEVFDYTAELFSKSKRPASKVRKMALKSAWECSWRCIDDRKVRAAQFRNRKDPKEWAILAPSAKGDGGWQISWFDERGPRGDSPRKTQCDAIKEFSSGFRYQGDTVIKGDKAVSDWYLEEWQ